MNIKIRDFLAEYNIQIPENVGQGDIYRITYSEDYLNIAFFAHFSQMQTAADCAAFEHNAAAALKINSVKLNPRYEESLFGMEVMPEITDTTEIELRDEDIKMDVYRSSGAGGQKVNKTSSAVRLTHIPTGIVVSSQVERSHFQNLENCKNMLRARLAEIKEREHLEKISDIKGVQMKIEWGSQIRSYVFMPYQLVKDHRTEYENGNIDNVMNGDLDGFINAFLSMRAAT